MLQCMNIIFFLIYTYIFKKLFCFLSLFSLFCSSCIFEKGCEQILIVASETIEKGQQLFHDYSKQFWQHSTKEKNIETLKKIQKEKIF